MKCETGKKLSYDDLKQYTNNFSEDNLIGKFQWGKVYRGYIGEQHVVVKKWEHPIIYTCFPGENEQRIRDEILLLQHPTMTCHPNMVNLIGYCDACEEQLGVVYDVDPQDSLDNLIPKDSFTWLQRIKVIVGFAQILSFMHAENPPNLPYLLLNISAAHIIVDKEYNAKLFDFGMITGGIFPDRRCMSGRPHVRGCYGYINLDPSAPGPGYWSERVDVCAFGVVLLMLISKRPPLDDLDLDNPTIYEWSDMVYKPRKSATGKFSLVHESLQQSVGFCASDGDKIELLARSCVDVNISARPTMKEVLKDLLELNAAQLVRIGMHFTLRQYLAETGQLSHSFFRIKALQKFNYHF